MGFLTVVVLHNDAMHAFKEDPTAFGKAILDGVNKANMEHRQVSVGFKNYANYIHVEPSRHADHHVLWLSHGNCVLAMGGYEADWEELCSRESPAIAEQYYRVAKGVLETAEESLQRAAKQRKEKQRAASHKPGG